MPHQTSKPYRNRKRIFLVIAALTICAVAWFSMSDVTHDMTPRPDQARSRVVPDDVAHQTVLPDGAVARPKGNAPESASPDFGSPSVAALDPIAGNPVTFTLGGHAPPGATAPNRSEPEHEISVSGFRIGRCETSAGEYCCFLNSAWNRGWLDARDTGSGFAVFGRTDEGTTPILCMVGPQRSDSPVIFDVGNKDAPFQAVGVNGESISNHPMTAVSWYGAAYYCNWFSLEKGLTPGYGISSAQNWTRVATADGYRLPTEAEWELAAAYDPTTGKKRIWPFGNRWDPALANVADLAGLPNPDGAPKTRPVDFNPGRVASTKPLNMAGNVWEWCQDWYSDYPKENTQDPEGPATGTIKIVRGGSFKTRAESAWCAFRGIVDPTATQPDIGFRIAISN